MPLNALRCIQAIETIPLTNATTCSGQFAVRRAHRNRELVLGKACRKPRNAVLKTGGLLTSLGLPEEATL
jgi:hypothetical protein